VNLKLGPIYYRGWKLEYTIVLILYTIIVTAKYYPDCINK